MLQVDLKYESCAFAILLQAAFILSVFVIQ